MKAYQLKDSKLYRRTQAEAKSNNPFGEEWEQVEIPTDAQGLVDYLNEIINHWAGRVHDMSIHNADLPEKVDDQPYSPPPVTSAIETLSGMDDGKNKVNNTVENIGSAGMYALSRYASAVAIRFQQIGVKK